MSKKLILSSAFFSLAVAGFIAFSASSVSAIPAFKDAFQSKYVKPDSTAASDVALASAFDKAKCGVCHVGPTKKVRNAYGQELNKFITKADKGNKKKISEALDKVAKMKSKPSDPTSPTYGDKISSGKLPMDD